MFLDWLIDLLCRGKSRKYGLIKHLHVGRARVLIADDFSTGFWFELTWTASWIICETTRAGYCFAGYFDSIFGTRFEEP